MTSRSSSNSISAALIALLLISTSFSANGYSNDDDAEEVDMQFDINSSKPQIRHYTHKQAGSVLVKTVKINSASPDDDEIKRRLVAYDLDPILPPYDDVYEQLILNPKKIIDEGIIESDTRGNKSSEPIAIDEATEETNDELSSDVQKDEEIPIADSKTIDQTQHQDIPQENITEDEELQDEVDTDKISSDDEEAIEVNSESEVHVEDTLTESVDAEAGARQEENEIDSMVESETEEEPVEDIAPADENDAEDTASNEAEVQLEEHVANEESKNAEDEAREPEISQEEVSEGKEDDTVETEPVDADEDDEVIDESAVEEVDVNSKPVDISVVDAVSEETEESESEELETDYTEGIADEDHILQEVDEEDDVKVSLEQVEEPNSVIENEYDAANEEPSEATVEEVEEVKDNVQEATPTEETDKETVDEISEEVSIEEVVDEEVLEEETTVDTNEAEDEIISEPSTVLENGSDIEENTEGDIDNAQVDDVAAGTSDESSEEEESAVESEEENIEGDVDNTQVDDVAAETSDESSEELESAVDSEGEDIEGGIDNSQVDDVAAETSDESSEEQESAVESEGEVIEVDIENTQVDDVIVETSDESSEEEESSVESEEKSPDSQHFDSEDATIDAAEDDTNAEESLEQSEETTSDTHAESEESQDENKPEKVEVVTREEEQTYFDLDGEPDEVGVDSEQVVEEDKEATLSPVDDENVIKEEIIDESATEVENVQESTEASNEKITGAVDEDEITEVADESDNIIETTEAIKVSDVPLSDTDDVSASEEDIIHSPTNSVATDDVEDEAKPQDAADDAPISDTVETQTKEPILPSVKKTSANDEFVSGLDDLHKFMEEVDPPDELDPGAAGLSIQEVLMEQGVEIIKTRVDKGVARIKRSLRTLKTKGLEKWNGFKDTVDDNFDVNIDETALTIVEKLEVPYQNVKEFFSDNKDKIDAVKRVADEVVTKAKSILSKILDFGGEEDEDEDDMEVFGDLVLNDDDMAEMRRKLMERYS